MFNLVSMVHPIMIKHVCNDNKNDEHIIFTKTKEVEFIPAFLISASPSYNIIIAFHLHDRTMWIIIIVHVHWTKLESMSIQ